jgi:hypothetical protein
MTLYRRIFAVLAWITLGVQYGLFLKALTIAAILERTVEYVSYFTIVTNFLIALAFTVPVLAPGSRAGRWWAAASPRGATTVFAVVVMVIYHLLLRSLWEPKGLQLANDYMLHYVMPIAMLVDWLAVTPRAMLQRDLAFRPIGAADIGGGLLGAAAGITAAVLGAGKHCLVEKPITPSFSALAALAAHPRAPVLMVGFHRRFAAEFLRARAWAAARPSCRARRACCPTTSCARPSSARTTRASSKSPPKRTTAARVRPTCSTFSPRRAKTACSSVGTSTFSSKTAMRSFGASSGTSSRPARR